MIVIEDLMLDMEYPRLAQTLLLLRAENGRGATEFAPCAENR